MKQRYVVTTPVKNGYSFFDINDAEANKTLVSIFEKLPNGVDPKVEAERLCALFNRPSS
jgi:hypothetical protein